MSTPSQPMPTLRVIDPRRSRRNALLLGLAWLISVLAALLVGRYVLIPGADSLHAQLAESRAALAVQRERLADAEQRLANVERSEQIARLGNENVQALLGKQEGELAELRRDLALYNRLIGPGAVRQSLSVHDVRLHPAADGSVPFTVILTQTQDVRRGSEGHLTLSVEGQRNGRLERLSWADLAPPGQVDGLPYDFRYFQRLDARFMLPGDFQPHGIRIRLRGRNGENVERSLRWQEAINQGKS